MISRLKILTIINIIGMGVSVSQSQVNLQRPRSKCCRNKQKKIESNRRVNKSPDVIIKRKSLQPIEKQQKAINPQVITKPIKEKQVKRIKDKADNKQHGLLDAQYAESVIIKKKASLAKDKQQGNTKKLNKMSSNSSNQECIHNYLLASQKDSMTFDNNGISTNKLSSSANSPIVIPRPSSNELSTIYEMSNESRSTASANSNIYGFSSIKKKGNGHALLNSNSMDQNIRKIVNLSKQPDTNAIVQQQHQNEQQQKIGQPQIAKQQKFSGLLETNPPIEPVCQRPIKQQSNKGNVHPEPNNDNIQISNLSGIIFSNLQQSRDQYQPNPNSNSNSNIEQIQSGIITNHYQKQAQQYQPTMIPSNGQSPIENKTKTKNIKANNLSKQQQTFEQCLNVSNEYHKLSQLATIDSTHSVDNKTSRNKHSPYSPHSAYSYTKFNANHIDIENSRQYPKTTPYLPIDNCNYNQPSMHSCNGGTSKLLYF